MRRTGFFLSAALGLLLAAACGHDDTKQQEALAREDSIRMANALKVAVLPTLDALPLLVAAESGVLDSLGTEAVLVPFKAQMDCDTALANGWVDVSVSDVVHAAWRQFRDGGLYIIGETDGAWQLVVQRSQRVRNLSGLKEKILSIHRNSTDEYLTYVISDSLKLEEDYIYRPQINDLEIRTKMVLNNQTDGAVLPEPYAAYAVAEGHTALFSSRGMDVPGTALVASWQAVNDSVKKQRIQRLILAYRAGCDLLAKRGIQAFPESMKRFPMSQAYKDTAWQVPVVRPMVPLSDGHRKQAVQWLLRRESVGKAYAGDTLATNVFTF